MIDIETGRGISTGIASQELAKYIFTSEDSVRIVDDFNGVSDEISEINETVGRFQGFLDGLADLLGNLIKQP